MATRYLWLAPVVVALLASAYFVQTLPDTPRTDGEAWVAPLGVNPLADDAREYLALADSLRQD